MNAGWPAQQRVFAAALLDPLMPVPGFLHARVGALPEERFDVYRNNVHASLIEALLAAFPVTARLVGEEFFRALAGEFLRARLPRGAALHDYGADLAGFIRGHEATASLPYLTDVARLEHAWWQSYGAADAPAMAVGDLAALPAGQLLALRARLHPAIQLLESSHPVHGIWAAHQVDEPAPVGQWQAECVLITRPEAAVQVRHIDEAQYAFFCALATNLTLEGAAEAALATNPGFDLGPTLLLAIEAGAIQELHA